MEEYLMTNLPFQALTERLEKELYRLHYTEASVIQYRRMWRRIAKVTQTHYRKIAEKFLSFLESQGIRHTTDITARHTSDSINTLMGYSYKTVELQLCGLRSFLRYLTENGLHPQELSQAIPALKARKQNRIPSVWTKDNVTKLLKAIDQGNPAGKRDYAIILLVTRLGLRTIDIKQLKLSDLHWRDNRIELTQSKTATPLTLPPLPLISDILGHVSTDSTAVYLKVDIDRLRECALNPEVGWPHE